MSVDTLPKNAADTTECNGFSNAKARSSVTRVGPASGEWLSTATGPLASPWSGGQLEGWGEVEEAGWKRHVV